MLPAFGLTKPFPILIRVKNRLLPAEKRDRAITLGVFHLHLPLTTGHDLESCARLRHDRYGNVTGHNFDGSEASPATPEEITQRRPVAPPDCTLERIYRLTALPLTCSGRMRAVPDAPAPPRALYQHWPLRLLVAYRPPIPSW